MNITAHQHFWNSRLGLWRKSRRCRWNWRGIQKAQRWVQLKHFSCFLSWRWWDAHFSNLQALKLQFLVRDVIFYLGEALFSIQPSKCVKLIWQSCIWYLVKFTGQWGVVVFSTLWKPLMTLSPPAVPCERVWKRDWGEECRYLGSHWVLEWCWIEQQRINPIWLQCKSILDSILGSEILSLVKNVGK